jgi:hypothetical protein
VEKTLRKGSKPAQFTLTSSLATFLSKAEVSFRNVIESKQKRTKSKVLMDFVRSYFFTNETLGSLTLFSSKLDSPVIKTWERHFFKLSECLSHVLRESNFDKKKVVNCPEFHSSRSNFLQDLHFK